MTTFSDLQANGEKSYYEYFSLSDLTNKIKGIDTEKLGQNIQKVGSVTQNVGSIIESTKKTATTPTSTDSAVKTSANTIIVTGKKSNALSYIAITSGILFIGMGIYFITKKS